MNRKNLLPLNWTKSSPANFSAFYAGETIRAYRDKALKRYVASFNGTILLDENLKVRVWTQPEAARIAATVFATTFFTLNPIADSRPEGEYGVRSLDGTLGSFTTNFLTACRNAGKKGGTVEQFLGGVWTVRKSYAKPAGLELPISLKDVPSLLIIAGSGNSEAIAA